MYSKSGSKQGTKGNPKRVSEETWNKRKRNFTNSVNGLRKRTKPNKRKDA